MSSLPSACDPAVREQHVRIGDFFEAGIFAVRFLEVRDSKIKGKFVWFFRHYHSGWTGAAGSAAQSSGSVLHIRKRKINGKKITTRTIFARIRR